jgi:DNA-binding NarL/FixJ family response regulator
MNASSIRVLVVDDHPVVRHGLLALLKYEPGMEGIGDAADGASAIDTIMDLAPDVVLLDLR